MLNVVHRTELKEYRDKLNSIQNVAATSFNSSCRSINVLCYIMLNCVSPMLATSASSLISVVAMQFTSINLFDTKFVKGLVKNP